MSTKLGSCQQSRANVKKVDFMSTKQGKFEQSSNHFKKLTMQIKKKDLCQPSRILVKWGSGKYNIGVQVTIM